MYTPDSEKKLWEKRNEYFKDGKLYICKEDIPCKNGVFHKGSLVQVIVCGSDSDETLSCDNSVYSIVELFTKFKNVYLYISDMDEFYNNLGNENEDEIHSYPKFTDTCVLTKDNIDEMYEKFEYQSELEHSIKEEEYASHKYFDKAEKCNSIGFSLFLLGFITCVVSTAVCVAITNISWLISCICTFGSFSIGTAGMILCLYFSDKYDDMACVDKNKRVYNYYVEWKNAQ